MEKLHAGPRSFERRFPCFSDPAFTGSPDGSGTVGSQCLSCLREFQSLCRGLYSTELCAGLRRDATGVFLGVYQQNIDDSDHRRYLSVYYCAVSYLHYRPYHQPDLGCSRSQKNSSGVYPLLDGAYPRAYYYRQRIGSQLLCMVYGLYRRPSAGNEDTYFVLSSAGQLIPGFFSAVHVGSQSQGEVSARCFGCFSGYSAV